jgi:hypothetical protein
VLDARLIATFKAAVKPKSNPPGAPRKPSITRAVELYRQQCRDIREGKRQKISWNSIALEVIHGFAKMLPNPRRIALDRLRNAVYKRIGQRLTKNPRRSK